MKFLKEQIQICKMMGNKPEEIFQDNKPAYISYNDNQFLNLNLIAFNSGRRPILSNDTDVLKSLGENKAGIAKALDDIETANEEYKKLKPEDITAKGKLIETIDEAVKEIKKFKTFYKAKSQQELYLVGIETRASQYRKPIQNDITEKADYDTWEKEIVNMEKGLASIKTKDGTLEQEIKDLETDIAKNSKTSDKAIRDSLSARYKAITGKNATSLAQVTSAKEKNDTENKIKQLLDKLPKELGRNNEKLANKDITPTEKKSYEDRNAKINEVLDKLRRAGDLNNADLSKIFKDEASHITISASAQKSEAKKEESQLQQQNIETIKDNLKDPEKRKPIINNYLSGNLVIDPDILKSSEIEDDARQLLAEQGLTANQINYVIKRVDGKTSVVDDINKIKDFNSKTVQYGINYMDENYLGYINNPSPEYIQKTSKDIPSNPSKKQLTKEELVKGGMDINEANNVVKTQTKFQSEYDRALSIRKNGRAVNPPISADEEIKFKDVLDKGDKIIGNNSIINAKENTPEKIKEAQNEIETRKKLLASTNMATRESAKPLGALATALSENDTLLKEREEAFKKTLPEDKKLPTVQVNTDTPADASLKQSPELKKLEDKNKAYQETNYNLKAPAKPIASAPQTKPIISDADTVDTLKQKRNSYGVDTKEGKLIISTIDDLRKANVKTVGELPKATVPEAPKKPEPTPETPIPELTDKQKKTIEEAKAGGAGYGAKVDKQYPDKNAQIANRNKLIEEVQKVLWTNFAGDEMSKTRQTIASELNNSTDDKLQEFIDKYSKTVDKKDIPEPLSEARDPFMNIGMPKDKANMDIGEKPIPVINEGKVKDEEKKDTPSETTEPKKDNEAEENKQYQHFQKNKAEEYKSIPSIKDHILNRPFTKGSTYDVESKELQRLIYEWTATKIDDTNKIEAEKYAKRHPEAKTNPWITKKPEVADEKDPLIFKKQELPTTNTDQEPIKPEKQTSLLGTQQGQTRNEWINPEYVEQMKQDLINKASTLLIDNKKKQIVIAMAANIKNKSDYDKVNSELQIKISNEQQERDAVNSEMSNSEGAK